MIIFVYNNNVLILIQFEVITRERDIPHFIFKKNGGYLASFLRNPVSASRRGETFFFSSHLTPLRSVLNIVIKVYSS